MNASRNRPAGSLRPETSTPGRAIRKIIPCAPCYLWSDISARRATDWCEAELLQPTAIMAGNMDEKECRTLEANLQYVRSVFCGRTKKWWAKKHALTPSGKASQDGKNEWHGQESTAKHAKHAKNSETVLASAPVQEKREMTRMIKCLLLRLLFAVLMVVPQQLRAADRPNVLFIAVDDLRDTLGCYGNSAVNVGPTTD